MELFINLSLAVTALCILLMIIGLYKPWVMLWWEDTQNRKKVIKVYGTAGMLFLALYYVLTYLAGV
ncbi:hypothetical protein C900_00915 [Fulvivirga imtechensis AK7]|uniref:Uncharacterized protein n=1 Tax=Fulvivirga imtechensis AK7 TaxID=1237149 RepID=L8JZ76_9BACT|nr:hypothetical protein [Fulvivirga imtechensis]ELR72954.1 hypothetical protein C900_00915 [Fulvivirga imtechensis AK7]